MSHSTALERRPAGHVQRRRSVRASSAGTAAPGEVRPALHDLEPGQAARLPRPPPGCVLDLEGAAAPDPGRGADHLPEDQDVEGVPDPRQGGQARSHRGGDRTLLRAGGGLGRARPARDQAAAGTCWAPRVRPHRLPANYHKPHGVRQFLGCYWVGADRLTGWMVRRQGHQADPRCPEAHPGELPRRGADLRDPRQPQPPQCRACVTGRPKTPSSCASHPHTPHRRTRYATSGRSATSSSRTATTPTTGPSPHACMRTCAGGTATPATPSSSKVPRAEQHKLRSE